MEVGSPLGLCLACFVSSNLWLPKDRGFVQVGIERPKKLDVPSKYRKLDW